MSDKEEIHIRRFCGKGYSEVAQVYPPHCDHTFFACEERDERAQDKEGDDKDAACLQKREREEVY